jgi:ATP-dependent Clp endopeptidase proteolytic subunit ClpP
MTRTWYEMKAQKDSADIYIFDEIGFFGITASRFVSDLQRYKGKDLNVFINSPGGDVFDSIAIYNALARHDGKVSVTVDGLAASGASVIAQAGKTRTMSTGSAMMIHDAWGVAMGDAATMGKMAEELDSVSDSVADIYAERTGKPPQEWRDRMRNETWYDADEAVLAGLADGVSAVNNAYSGRIFNLSRYEHPPARLNAAHPYNVAVKEAFLKSLDGLIEAWNQPGDPVQTSPEGQEDDMDETAVRQALGLDADGDIAGAIAALRTRADVAEATLKADAPDKAEAAQLRSQLQETQQEVLSLKTKHAEEILKLRDEQRRTTANHMVEAAVSAGFVLPSDRGLAYDLAYNNPEAFEQFKARQRVDLTERGSAAALDGIELTPEEAKVAAQMGWSRDELIQFKAKEQGIR